MRKRKPVVITLFAGKTAAGNLYAYAEPDPAIVYVGDVIIWRVVASDGVKGVKPAHFRLKGTCMETAPFITKVPEKRKGGDYAARAKKSGFTRTYKYDIMVGDVVAADPDIQIKDAD